MGKKIDRAVNAERLLALHDELDGLDKKESFVALSVVLFVLAAVLMVVGMPRGSVYLEVNGLFLAIGGVIFGVKEVSKARRMRVLGRRIAELEDGWMGGMDERALDGIGEKAMLEAPS